MKTLYFEEAGCSSADISKATIGNCRIHTAFHLDNLPGAHLYRMGKASPATLQMALHRICELLPLHSK